MSLCDSSGYYMVKLSNGCVKTAKMKKVHRLVAEAFIPNPNNYELLTYMVELDDMTIMVMLNEALAGGSVVVACNTDGLPGMGAARIATMTITSIGTTQENIGNISSIAAHDKITALFANIFRYVSQNIVGAQEGDQNVEESDEVDTP